MTTTSHRWAARTAIAGTVFIALGAFWLSFTALTDLAIRSGIDQGQSWAWPLIVDGIIVVATVSVVALGGQRAAWYPWMLLAGGALISVTANAIHAVVAADANVPGVLAASVAAVPPVVLLAITHLTVILTRARNADLDPSVPPVIWAMSSVTQSEAVSDQVAPLALPGATGGASDSAVEPSVEPGSDRRARGHTLRDAGWSNKRIARELGVHPSTVGRWFATAHLPDTTDSAGVREEETTQ